MTSLASCLAQQHTLKSGPKTDCITHFNHFGRRSTREIMFSGNSQNDLTALGNASEAQAEKQHTARALPILAVTLAVIVGAVAYTRM